MNFKTGKIKSSWNTIKKNSLRNFTMETFFAKDRSHQVLFATRCYRWFSLQQPFFKNNVLCVFLLQPTSYFAIVNFPKLISKDDEYNALGGMILEWVWIHWLNWSHGIWHRILVRTHKHFYACGCNFFSPLSPSSVHGSLWFQTRIIVWMLVHYTLFSPIIRCTECTYIFVWYLYRY